MAKQVPGLTSSRLQAQNDLQPVNLKKEEELGTTKKESGGF